MNARFPIGTSDFAKIRREGSYYVDKTGLAVELIRATNEAVLFPRPRRFGKTLNLSMLRYWFERVRAGEPNDIAALFAGLEVATAGADVSAHFQRYPVIFLTFKDVKHREWADCRADVFALVRHEVLRHEAVWRQAVLAQDEQQALDAVAAGTGSDTQVQSALRLLCRALHLATGEAAVLLIDEYDTPIHSGWSFGYYDEVVELFRNLLSGALKDNSHLYRGVLTGILRVAKESIFSGLNNVAVFSLLATPFSRWFGFTEDEVAALCAAAGPEADLAGVREWYNGYLMGGRIVYNPWSLVNYLSALPDGLKPYWVNTASDDILRDLLIRQGPALHAELAELIQGREIVQPISENIQLRDLGRTPADVWSFLLFTGYLKARNVRQVGGEALAHLSIPNQEVRVTYSQIFRRWLDMNLGDARPDDICRSLLTGEERGFEARFQRLVLNSLSYFDTGGKTPEAVYQAFLVGLLVQLDRTHVVDSNRESGYGRYDVCVRPRLDVPGPRAGAVLELKSIDVENGDTVESALTAAMQQIHDRQYAAALREAGADPIWLWAAVFDGKRVRVRLERG
ncbi:hypothetical protein LBMAG42_49820 [Deltaproteobacteria bacterium]|nr:hypothetical protein LBMAG42_49820 [Deltaproteobacteria bacterium]